MKALELPEPYWESLKWKGALGIGLPGFMHIFASRVVQLSCDVSFSLTKSPVFCEINTVKFYFVDFTSRLN